MLSFVVKFFRAAFSMMALGLFFFGGSFKATAADYVVRTWEVDDGLPLSAITDVAQTPDGYLWVGTLLGGFSRFDGARFVNYDMLNVPQLKNNSVRKMLVDSQGALWILTFGSLVRWQDGVFHQEMEHDSKAQTLLFSDAHQVIFTTANRGLLIGTRTETNSYQWNQELPSGGGANLQFCADVSGAVWYRGEDGALWRWHDGRAEKLSGELSGQQINVLAADSKRQIWVGTDQGIYHWDGSAFQNCTPTNGEANLMARRLTPVGENSVWVEANGRLRLCRDRVWESEAKLSKKDSPVGSSVQFVKDDGERGMWISLTDGGLVHVAVDGKVRRAGSREDFPSTLVRCLFVDGEHNLWAGFERAGLVQIRKRLFRTIGKPEGLADGAVVSLCESPVGAVWMGTVGGSLGRWASNRCENITLPLLGSRCLYAVANADAESRLWVGTTGNGLFTYDGSQFHQVATAEEISSDIRLLLPGRDGKIWLASQTMLWCYDHGQLTNLRKSSLPLHNFAALAEGTNGNLWIGTIGGELLRYADGQFESIRLPAEIPKAHFWAMRMDAAGTLWIGTSAEGLLRFKNGVFNYLPPGHGLPSGGISQILDDDQGGLWLGTRSSLSRVSKAEVESCMDGRQSAISCRTFGHSDGLRTVGCAVEYQPLCFQARDGRLWFAMANGVANIQPADFVPNRQSPQIFIEEVLLDGKNIFQSTNAIVGKLENHFEIEPGQHDLEFRYTGISLSNPEGVRFRYRLEGLDKQWQMAGPSRSAIYRYLPPGNYVFHVSACNSDGVWNDVGASVAFILKPFLWQRAWFPWATVTAVATLILFSVVIWLRARHRRRLAALQQIQAIENERLRIARDLHDDVGASLTQISNLGELASRRAEQPEALLEHLARLKEKSRETLQTLDQIVWTVNPRNDGLSRSTSYFTHTARDLLEGSGIRCRLRVPDELPAAQLTSRVRHHLLLVIKEAVRNVLKHSGADEMFLTIAADQKILTVTIVDNGHGFDPAQVNHERNGLQNMARRLEELGGGFDLKTAPGKGTTITITVPLEPEHS